jgi:hypothetical protein
MNCVVLTALIEPRRTFQGMVFEGKAFIGTDSVYNFSADDGFEYRQPRKRVFDSFCKVFGEVQHCTSNGQIFCYWSKTCT